MLKDVIKFFKKINPLAKGGGRSMRSPGLAWVILVSALVVLNITTVTYHIFFVSRNSTFLDDEIDAIPTGDISDELDLGALREYRDTLNARAEHFEDLVGFAFGSEISMKQQDAEDKGEDAEVVKEVLE